MSPRDTLRAESLPVPSSWWPGGRYLCSFDAIYLPLSYSRCYFTSPALLCCPGPRDCGLALCLGKCRFLLFWVLFVTPSPKMGAALGEQVPRETLAAWCVAPSLPSQTLARLGSHFASFCRDMGWKTAFEGRQTARHPPLGVGGCCPAPHPGFWGSLGTLIPRSWLVSCIPGWKHPGAERFVLITIRYFGISFSKKKKRKKAFFFLFLFPPPPSFLNALKGNVNFLQQTHFGIQKIHGIWTNWKEFDLWTLRNNRVGVCGGKPV